MDAIVVALISGAVTLLGVLIANSRSQAVTETKLDELTREVREHNNFARRMPVVEEQIKVINHRIGDLDQDRFFALETGVLTIREPAGRIRHPPLSDPFLYGGTRAPEQFRHRLVNPFSRHLRRNRQ